MFNQMSPDEVVTGIGAVLRGAAGQQDEKGEFGRDQLLSAFSATRHLAVELSAYQAEFERFLSELGQAVPEAASRVGAEPDPRQAGEELCRILDELRGDDSPPAREQEAAIRSALRDLVDREVALLAEGLS